MLPAPLATMLGPLDIAALIVFLVVWISYGIISGSKGFVGRSLVGAVQRQRELWMQNMVRRDNRVLDQVLLGTLGQGSAFFASTSAIAIGGLFAVMGSGEKVQAFMERLPYADLASPVLFEFKLALIMMIFVFAFFKFAWAFRLSHYAAIMIGAAPIVREQDTVLPPGSEEHALQTAHIAGLSAEHSNGGIRAFYYAIAAATWIYHPVAFMLATTWVLLILTRRDFFSRSRAVLAAAALTPSQTIMNGRVADTIAAPQKALFPLQSSAPAAASSSLMGAGGSGKD